ncbi:hypothetical protein DENSPDRAFT_843688 [Dentipellis sp. KUC8613]|nr:hypothetical protein DENSPDRAFT_843688 [Dentipellis sp. KUC8613]
MSCPRRQTLMSSYNAPSHGVSPHISSSSQCPRLGGYQPTHDPSRKTWSDPYCQRLRLEYSTVLDEFDAVSDQFFNGSMTIYEFEGLYKHYTARMNALTEELDEERKKEAPSPVQKAMDWGYTKENAEKMWLNYMEQRRSNNDSSRNNFLDRRDVRGH